LKSRKAPEIRGFNIPQFRNLQFHEGSVKAFMKKENQNIKPQNSTTEDTEKKSFQIF